MIHDSKPILHKHIMSDMGHMILAREPGTDKLEAGLVEEIVYERGWIGDDVHELTLKDLDSKKARDIMIAGGIHPDAVRTARIRTGAGKLWHIRKRGPVETIDIVNKTHMQRRIRR